MVWYFNGNRWVSIVFFSELNFENDTSIYTTLNKVYIKSKPFWKLYRYIDTHW